MEAVKGTMDNRGVTGAVLADYDCLNHELLIAKLNPYAFSRCTLLFIHTYLTDRNQRVKVNGSFSTWAETVLGVPQDSVLVVFMLLEEIKICNYADSTTIYSCGPNIENVIMHLENDALKITEWFHDNRMKLTEDKCHLMIFG